MSHDPLKLLATDSEDVAVLAACLQDALVPIAEMEYIAAERRFALVANRFRWENCDESHADCGAFERVNCGIAFESVTGVRHRNIDRADRGQILNLLTIEVEGGAVNLLFAGGGVISLDVERVRCLVRDIGEPWPTKWRPQHAVVEGDGG
jgi:hypothetical protein